MAVKKWQKKPEEGAPTWMITYSDLMTQLVVFFVLLFSFSVINQQKFQQFIASYQGMGILDGGVSPIVETEPAPSNYPENLQTPEAAAALARAQEMMQTYQTVKNFLTENGLESEVEVRYEDRGIALDIKERILFDSGRADLKPEARQLLDKLSGLLSRLPNEVKVEGYTDNRPIHTVQFPTNWELSTARAARVVRYFIEEHHLQPDRFMAIGYGEYHPLYPNDSPEHMAENRRVVLLLGVTSSQQNQGKEVYKNAP
ncbi:OmpA family protein [Neomoorella thermoacetica]|uniref:OmpA family protein n=1 Tax=Neomoorella thermoacetica TaxID=1525 RepID=UPI0008FB94F4|nr:OmpA family protein [Moorella thermoacetica]APC07902.1 motility protein B [Moorella thermoacetica]